MEKIAALVEGHTEEHFVRATYAAAHIARPFPNGEDVDVCLIIDSIADALEVISGDIEKVLILLDREKRKIDAVTLTEQIIAGLAAKGCKRKICIGVADRTIENWILADEQEMRKRYDTNFVYPGDGTSGKSGLKELCKGISLGPRDRAMLLKECSATRASSRSMSLTRLLQTVNFEWIWTKG